MKFVTKPPSSSLSGVDVLGLCVTSKGLATPLGRDLDRRLGGALSRIIKTEELKGKAGESRLAGPFGHAKSDPPALLIRADLKELRFDGVHFKKVVTLGRASGKRSRQPW